MPSRGLFHTIYHTVPGISGGVSLTLNLLVHTPTKKITGHARVFQATHPALDLQYDVRGDYTQVNVFLRGAPYPIYLVNLAGHTHGGCLLTPAFSLHGVFQGGWQQGNVAYRYQSNGVWHDQSQTIQAQYSPPRPPFLPMPLYAAALQQASASGNLAELKQLAAAAQAQLEQSDDIRLALDQLNTHIAEREKHHVPTPPYGVAIQQAISSGDLAGLKQLAHQVEQQINQSTQLGSALAELKQHISALEQ